MPRLYCTAALIALLGWSAANSARADTYSVNVQVALPPLASDPGVVTLMVPGFDTSLGTLTGFSFQLSGTLSRTVFVNRSEQPLVGTFANTVSVIGSNDGVISLPDAAASGPAGNEITGAVPISFSATLTPGFLASIAPGADIDLNLIFGGRLTFNGSLGASSERIGFSGPIQVTETFTFTPVPEPVSLSLLGMGVVGLAALRRKSSGNAAI